MILIYSLIQWRSYLKSRDATVFKKGAKYKIEEKYKFGSTVLADFSVLDMLVNWVCSIH